MRSCCLLLLLALLQRYQPGASECGVPAGQSRIVGGQAVPDLRYPWYVALVTPSSTTSLSVSCGGSLVSPKHILTAAHCFPKSAGVRPEQLYRAVFQLVNRCSPSGSSSSAISKVHIYPSFDPQTLQGDVAVATLPRAVSLMPVCLPRKNSFAPGPATIIGFGSTLAKSQYPCVLQEAKVNIYSRRQCARSDLTTEFSRIPGTLCAGVQQGGVDSCDGDSGGPLLTTGSTGTYTIRGIVSFGEGCARKNLPGVYTQVSAYIDFIDRVMQSSTDDDGDGGNTFTQWETTTTIPTSTPSHTLLQDLMGLLRPLTDLFGAYSSSGGDESTPTPDDSTGADVEVHRPLSPLHTLFQGFLNHHRWRDRFAPPHAMTFA